MQKTGMFGTNDEFCDRVFIVKDDWMHLGVWELKVGFSSSNMPDAIRVQEWVK